MRIIVAVAACALAGCAQLLGLDNTKLETPDVPDDATSLCDADATSCTASTGRSACGQLVLAGTDAGPLRVATPTGAVCDAGNTEGPCALSVSAVPTQSLFDGTSTGEVLGQIDDCGRFVVADIDATVVDVAIKLSDAAGAYQPSARLLINRSTTVGEVDRGIEAVVVLKTTTVEWATQLSLPPDATSTGYLVRYTSGTGMPLVNEAVAVDQGSPLTNPPGTIPWAGYFGGTSAFGALTPGATVTSESGTAFAGMPAGPFSLEGFRQGRRCARANLKTVGNVLIHVVEDDC